MPFLRSPDDDLFLYVVYPQGIAPAPTVFLSAFCDEPTLSGFCDAPSISGTPGMPSRNPLRLACGETLVVGLLFLTPPDDQGNQFAFSLAGVTDIIVTAKKYNNPSAPQIFQKSITGGAISITDSDNGQAAMVMAAADTSSMPGQFWHDVKLVYSSGLSPRFANIGPLFLEDHVNR